MAMMEETIEFSPEELKDDFYWGIINNCVFKTLNNFKEKIFEVEKKVSKIKELPDEVFYAGHDNTIDSKEELINNLYNGLIANAAEEFRQSYCRNVDHMIIIRGT